MEGCMKKACILICFLVSLSGCCWFCQTTPPCGDWYRSDAKINPTYLPDATMIESISKQRPKQEHTGNELVTLCNNALQQNIKLHPNEKIREKQGEICKTTGLSEKDVEDCKKNACQAQIKREWYISFYPMFVYNLSECKELSFDLNSGAFVKKE
jgi:hypothetical protein